MLLVNVSAPGLFARESHITFVAKNVLRTLLDKDGEVWMVQLKESNNLFSREQLIYMIKNNIASFVTVPIEEAGLPRAHVIVVKRKLKAKKKKPAKTIEILTTAADKTQQNNLLKLRKAQL
jgi:hypothetical protein